MFVSSGQTIGQTGYDLFYNDEVHLEEAACSSMSENQAEGAETFVKIFSRLDYLRFASGSLDSQKKPESLWQTEITAEEKKSLVEEGIYAIIKLNEVNNAGI